MVTQWNVQDFQMGLGAILMIELEISSIPALLEIPTTSAGEIPGIIQALVCSLNVKILYAAPNDFRGPA